MPAYYNEIDDYAAEWLGNLIAGGHIASGDVDRRSIVDVRADDLTGYDQCHFFAGIGGWSLALQLAGWPDDRPVWTGSCPCQPFSSAGQGKAADDERHLWPRWFPLIGERRPAVVFGEQVEAAIGWGWLDAVLADLEDEGYACGATVLPASSVGAPHIRSRAWFVADADTSGWGEQRRGRLLDGERSSQRDDADGRSAICVATGELGDADDARSQRRIVGRDGPDQRAARPAGVANGLGDSASDQQRRARLTEAGDGRQGTSGRSGAWSDIEWLPCRDGKARPVEPGTFPLAHGIPGRVGRLRAYGNAIVPQVAAEFIAAFAECRP